MSNRVGTLYGIGVGPGDPDLIPLKSVKILSRIDVVFAASSTKNRHSQAVNIARPHIPETAAVILLSFPMTKDLEEKKHAWRGNAGIMIETLKQGKDAAFLTLGDPMTYSTYGYVVRYLQRMDVSIPIKTIPGITSYQAAAARTNTPLMEGEESLLVLSGVRGGNHLRQRLGDIENVVFLKAYKNAVDIVSAVEEAGLLENSYGIVNCGLPEEEVVRDIRELSHREPGYWTLIVAKKNSGNEL